MSTPSELLALKKDLEVLVGYIMKMWYRCLVGNKHIEF